MLIGFLKFSDWVVFHCMYISHFLYPFLCLWPPWVAYIPSMLWNNAEMKIVIQRDLFEIMISFPLCIHPDGGLLEHVVALFLNSWGATIVLSIEAGQFTFPPTTYKPSLFAIFSTDWLSLVFLVKDILQVCGDISLWLWLHSLMINQAPFHAPIGYLYVSFRKISIQFLCLFFNWIFFFFFFLLGCMSSLFFEY